MEQNFQTSFIPKKPMITERALAARPIGLLPIISAFVLFTVLLATGGLYFYKVIKQKSLVQMENDLNLAKNRFEPAKITELQSLDKRLNASSEILAKHISVTPIFQALQSLTMKTVRYTQFNYVLGAEVNSKVKIKLRGLALGYSAIALQSELFTSKDIGKNFIDPVFSNLLLDDKGNVLFDLEFLVDPSFVDYKQMLLTENTTNTDATANDNFITPTAPTPTVPTAPTPIAPTPTAPTPTAPVPTAPAGTPAATPPFPSY